MKEPSPTTDADNHFAVSMQPATTLEEPAGMTKVDVAMLKKGKKRILPQQLA